MKPWIPSLAVVAFVLSTAGTAWAAGPPFANFCTIPSFIDVVGTFNGVPDPAGGVATVIVKDSLNHACPNVPVTLDFSQCETRLALVQAAGETVDPSHNSVTVMTDNNGVAQFTVVGAADPTASAAGVRKVRICAGGVLLGPAGGPTAVVFDLDGSLNGGDGVNANDIPIMMYDVQSVALGAPYRGRSDFNHDFAINGSDVAAFINKVFIPALQGLGSARGSNGAGFCSGPFTPFCQ